MAQASSSSVLALEGGGEEEGVLGDLPAVRVELVLDGEGFSEEGLGLVGVAAPEEVRGEGEDLAVERFGRGVGLLLRRSTTPAARSAARSCRPAREMARRRPAYSLRNVWVQGPAGGLDAVEGVVKDGDDLVVLAGVDEGEAQGAGGVEPVDRSSPWGSGGGLSSASSSCEAIAFEPAGFLGPVGGVVEFDQRAAGVGLEVRLSQGGI